MASWIVIVTAPSAQAIQQEPPTVPTSQDSDEKADPNEPLTPFEQTMMGVSDIAQGAIERAVTRACRKRGVPDAQRDAIRDAVVAQWRSILDPRDPTVHDLVMGYLNMRTGDAPPSREDVKAWADLAGTLRDKHATRLLEKQEERRNKNAPQQCKTLELELAVMTALHEMSQAHIERWQRGEFKADEFWQEPVHTPVTADAPAVQPRALPPNTDSPNPTAQPAPLDPISIELEGWTKYVKDFIRRFDLDQGQQDAAQSCLLELTARANAHRERYAKELLALERSIQSKTTSPQIEADITRDLVRLYGPIDDMFAELRARLDQIPTKRQRKNAARSQKPQPAGKP